MRCRPDFLHVIINLIGFKIIFTDMGAYCAPSLISGGGPKRPPPPFSWESETSPLIGLTHRTTISLFVFVFVSKIDARDLIFAQIWIWVSEHFLVFWWLAQPVRRHLQKGMGEEALRRVTCEESRVKSHTRTITCEVACAKEHAGRSIHEEPCTKNHKWWSKLMKHTRGSMPDKNSLTKQRIKFWYFE